MAGSTIQANARAGKVLLVSPPGGAPNLAPSLSLCYLAAALRQADIEVGVQDLAAPHGPRTAEALVARIRASNPDLIGLTVFTETALPAYHLAEQVRSVTDALLVAGGPHATALPEEALAHGFDIVVRGEGERTLVELARAVCSPDRLDGFDPSSRLARQDETGRTPDRLDAIAGLSYRDRHGDRHHTPERRLLVPLDELASPLEALDLFDRTWYVREGSPDQLPATILSSRGCTGRCTFCANVVFGQRYRFHSPRRVVEEMETWHRLEQTRVFNFCDSAFTIGRRRLLSLCRAMETLPFRPLWWCETRVDQMDREMARAMRQAGCLTVIMGLESGDPAVLARVRKGIDLEQAAQVLKEVKQAGLRTQVNFMFGLPRETPKELESTLSYMERIAPHVDLFSPMGVFIPYPGSALYQQYHQELGFTGWWLDRERVERLYRPVSPLPPDFSLDQVFQWHAELERSVLEAGLIAYSPETVRLIEQCLAFRREHNRERISRLASTL